jgi:signal transduction histidine kinase
MRMLPGAGTISAKLIRMNLLVCGAVLLLAALAFFSYDLFSFRNALIHTLEAEAQIIGDNSVAALLFDDQASAEKTLQALSRSPDILSATLATNDGTEFAKYQAPGKNGAPETQLLPPGEQEHVWTNGRRVQVAHRIIFQGKPAGTVYIMATLTELSQRARKYLFITAFILLLCMAAALIISSTSGRRITRPIMVLAETARSVSRHRDYSIRVMPPEGSSEEIGVLIEAFNQMLGQIEERDLEVRQARDLLELRVERRTAELKAANQELEAFSYTVAHDLRGPLDGIKGIAFLLHGSRDTGGDPETSEMLKQLQITTENMSLLIDDLLNFARASTTALKTQKIDLTGMSRDITQNLKSSEPDRDTEIKIAPTPEIEADGALMHVVMDNLLRNAWKYTSRTPHACIEFGAKREGGRVVYFVRDDGAGFDPANADQLFQPFQRLHSKRDFPGTGIGLATVHRILSRYGGEIWAEGAIGKGATFYFTLKDSSSLSPPAFSAT